MPFDWDFLPTLTNVKQLKRSASALTLASLSNFRRESMISQSSAASSAVYDTIQEEISSIGECYVEKKEERYVQQGMRNMKVRNRQKQTDVRFTKIY